ncbi:hypothetical protein KAR91_33905 [Candidatus Pacearchaeota archaeon]|nr:hypothetical protein [Candidatus Pacearchaeota archaeon]
MTAFPPGWHEHFTKQFREMLESEDCVQLLLDLDGNTFEASVVMKKDLSVIENSPEYKAVFGKPKTTCTNIQKEWDW